MRREKATGEALTIKAEAYASGKGLCVPSDIAQSMGFNDSTIIDVAIFDRNTNELIDVRKQYSHNF